MPQRSRQSRAQPSAQYNRGQANHPQSRAPNFHPPQPNHYPQPTYQVPNAGGYMPSSGMNQVPGAHPQYMNHGNGQSYPPQYFNQPSQQYSQYQPEPPAPPSRPKKIAVSDAIGLLSKRLGFLEEKVASMDMPEEEAHAQQSINSNIIQKLEALQEQVSAMAMASSTSSSMKLADKEAVDNQE
jgi:hypothetical protein